MWNWKALPWFGSGRLIRVSRLPFSAQNPTKKIGLFFPAGLCFDVSAGGHFQSSAMGLLAKSFGSGMDHVKRVRLVLPKNGKIIDVTEKKYPDLFFSILGGGSGSWGIVIEYELKPLYDKDYPNSALGVYKWEFPIGGTLEGQKNLVRVWSKMTFSILNVVSFSFILYIFKYKGTIWSIRIPKTFF